MFSSFEHRRRLDDGDLATIRGNCDSGDESGENAAFDFSADEQRTFFHRDQIRERATPKVRSSGVNLGFVWW